MCSNWDADLEERERKNLEVPKQMNNGNKTCQPSPKPTSVDTLILQSSKPLIDWFGNQIIVSSEKTLEDID